ncbi:unnamed protein product [Hapterophycus canaliculatus]
MERTRVKNGYGLCTSPLSVSVIGQFDGSSEKRKADTREWDRRYHTDATFQGAQQRENHPVRKILHMQKCYPETVLRLNQKGSMKRNIGSASTARPVSSRWHRNPSPNNKNSAPEGLRQQTARSTNGGQQDLSDDAARGQVAREYLFCRDKMAYNRTKGREAEVDGILTGTSPLEKKMPLFPAKATHQQLLGLVHRPSHPEKPAPSVPRERRWLGSNVGWEGNRGLPTPPAGRNAKDGEVLPWPSSQYPSFGSDPQ